MEEIRTSLGSDHPRSAANPRHSAAGGRSFACYAGRENTPNQNRSRVIRIKTDPKTVQSLLRHSDVKVTLQLYSHSASDGSHGSGRSTAGCDSRHSAHERGLKAD